MITDIKSILKKLDIDKPGRYDGAFYVITLDDSDDYARMYTKLDKNAVNTEYPQFGVNTNNTTVKATNYFEVDVNNVTYNIFLVADFDTDTYQIRLTEK